MYTLKGLIKSLRFKSQHANVENKFIKNQTDLNSCLVADKCDKQAKKCLGSIAGKKLAKLLKFICSNI